MIPRVERVNWSGEGVLVDFDNGDTVLFSPTFLWQNRSSDVNHVLPREKLAESKLHKK
jgi:hypothetical protein